MAKRNSSDANKVSTWEGSRRPSGASFTDDDDKDLILWIESETGKVRACTLVDEDEDGPASFWESLQTAIEKPLTGIPGRPEHILIDDPEICKSLQALANEHGIKVSYKVSLPQLDEAYYALTDFLDEGPGYSYLGDGKILPSQVEAMAKETVRYLKDRPFDDIDSDTAIRLEGPWDSPLYATVLGNAGLEFGLALYFTREGYVAALSGAEPDELLSHPILSLTLVDEDDCPAELHREVGLHEWPVHPMGCLLYTSPSPRD